MKFDNSFLYHKIKRYLSEEILKKAVDGQEIRLDSERDMAEDLNVSRFSVNKAISELVTEGYLIKRRGKGVYIPPREQLASLQNQANTIVLIIPDTSVYYYGEIAREFENIAFERNYKIVLSLPGNDSEKEKSVLTGIPNQSIRGVIAAPYLSDRNSLLYKQLHQSGIPVVLIGRIHPSMEDLPYIVYDQGEGCFQGARLLAEQGRRNVLYIGDNPASYLSRLRQEGLDRAASSYELACSELFISDPEFQTKLISYIRERRINGIICYNDLIAVQAMNVLIRSGIPVPDEVSIISYDNSSHAEVAIVPLTSVKFPKAKLARLAFETLIGLLEGRDVDRKLVISTEMELRDSTRSNTALPPNP